MTKANIAALIITASLGLLAAGCQSTATNENANANMAKPWPTMGATKPANIAVNANMKPANANAKMTQRPSPRPSPQATPPDSNMNSNTSVFSQLRGEANVAFTTPDSMKLEETKDIELLVSPSKSTEELLHNLSEPGKGETGTTEYADRMEAQLVGEGFTITAASPEIQPVVPGRTTRWKWQIKPKEGGPQRLDLTLNAVLNDGKDRSLVQTFHRDIRINVSWRQRASTFIAGLKDVQWLWAAIILPVAATIYGWWRKKRRRRQR